jgi:uncharacterized protein (DUF1501 family)
MADQGFHTRREFIRTTLLGGAVCGVMPAFLNQTVSAVTDAADGSLIQTATGKDDPILVAIQLAGGNDGLNTVIPYHNDIYYEARPRLAIPAGQVLRLDDQLGFHPRMEKLKALYDEGLMSIQQGVGYPNPNRSHFRSTEIWQTASDPTEFLSKGWIGRYFDNYCSGEDAAVGLALKNEMPQAFASDSHKGIAFKNIKQYSLQGTRQSKVLSSMEEDEEFFDAMNGMDDGGSVSSIGHLSPPQGVSALDYLEKVAMNATVTSEEIQAILKSNTAKQTFPKNAFGNDLATVAKLIGAGYSTRVYFANLGGFDTHANQLNAHANLMGIFSEGIHAFMKEMQAQGNDRRVLVMVFSEFGRRVSENASQGTDHGAAAPLFMFGGSVQSGLHGVAPSLRPDDLHRGDVKHTTDFRSVYATVMKRHLKVDGKPVLGESFPQLDCLKG